MDLHREGEKKRNQLSLFDSDGIVFDACGLGIGDERGAEQEAKLMTARW